MKRLEPYSTCPKWERQVPAVEDVIKRFSNDLLPMWNAFAEQLVHSFGDMYKPIAEQHDAVRKRRVKESYDNYRNLLSRTPFVHANLSSKGSSTRTVALKNKATQVCTHTDRALHKTAPIICVF